ncbi:MAG: hypothetical protein ACPGVO_07825 [Spirulinaceae cyanobacterium]
MKANTHLIEAALIASLGAGIVTSFAISQGQHPLQALLITLLAATFATLCRKYGLV